jgi:hypothetical protein
MDFRAILSAEQPPARDDEPASLRQDIVDELGDHLSCAYNRELLRGAGPDAAREAVLSKFGDPAALARRLWIDAMRGKIMAQRVLVATCLVVALSSVAFVGIAWSRMNREEMLRILAAREALEATRRISQALAESQATNEEMLKRLEAMSKAVQSPQTPDWIPVTFQLTLATLDGPPAAGWEAYLGKATGNRFMGMGSMGGGGMGGMGGGGPQWTDAIHRVSDENGLVDFGVVQPGDWEFAISSGSKRMARRWSTTGSMNVLPGTKVQKPIICPKEEPEPAEVQIRVAWPEDLAPRGYVIETWLSYEAVSFQPALEWSLGPGGRQFGGRNILLGARGSAMRYTELSWQVAWAPQLYLWHFPKPMKDLEGWGPDATDPTHVFGYLIPAGPFPGGGAGGLNAARYRASDQDALRFDPGRYHFKRMAVLRPRAPQKLPGDDVDPGGDWFDLLAYAEENPVSGFVIHSLETLADVMNGLNRRIPIRQGGGQPEASRALKRIVLPPEFWRGKGTGFEVHSGTANEGVLRLPDELIEAIRKESGSSKMQVAKPEGNR